MTQLSLDGCTGIVLSPDNEPDRDTWCTPRWIAEAVGEWDLDPCSNSRSHIRAAQSCNLMRGEDGLAFAADVGPGARVWINPPYSAGQVIRWIRAYRHTRFCFLVRLDPSTEWFAELYAASSLILVPAGRRVDFDPPPGVKASINPFPHAMFYASREDATEQIRALCFAWSCR